MKADSVLAAWIGIGAGVGATLGVILDGIGVWMAIGAGAGIAIGAAEGAAQRGRKH